MEVGVLEFSRWGQPLALREPGRVHGRFRRRLRRIAPRVSPVPLSFSRRARQMKRVLDRARGTGYGARVLRKQGEPASRVSSPHCR